MEQVKKAEDALRVAQVRLDRLRALEAVLAREPEDAEFIIFRGAYNWRAWCLGGTYGGSPVWGLIAGSNTSALRVNWRGVIENVTHRDVPDRVEVYRRGDCDTYDLDKP